MKRFNNTLLMAAAAVAVLDGCGGEPLKPIGTHLTRGLTITPTSPLSTVWRIGRRTTSTTRASGSLATLIIVTAPMRRGGRQDQRTQSPMPTVPAQRWATSR